LPRRDRPPQALDRILANEAERAAHLRGRGMIESLQRSLLTRPATDGVELAVRYLPAVQEAKVGGDWYDAFPREAAGTALVSVGDVAGHHGDAAAPMARLRSLLRGLAIDCDDRPATLLRRLNRAIDHLELRTLDTAVLVEVSATDPDRSGSWVRWSSAGHIPPLVRLPDGGVLVLERAEADLMLGVDLGAPRAEEWLHVPAGARLVLSTDGLVERREENLEVGLERLRGALAADPAHDVDVLCDCLLAAALPEDPFDDVLLVVVGTGVPPGADRPVATTVLPAVAAAVRSTRRFVDDVLGAAGVSPEATDDALLCTSEAVSKQRCTATSWVTVDVAVRDGVVQVGVRDTRPGTPTLTPPDDEATGAAGLLLIDALSSRWGTEEDGPGSASGSRSGTPVDR